MSSLLFHRLEDLPCCRKESQWTKKLSLQRCFYTGGISTCCTHICQHYELYKTQCKAENIPMNHHAVPLWWLTLCKKESQLQSKKNGFQSREVKEKSIFLTFFWLFLDFSWLKSIFFDCNWLSFSQRPTTQHGRESWDTLGAGGEDDGSTEKNIGGRGSNGPQAELWRCRATLWWELHLRGLYKWGCHKWTVWGTVCSIP